MQTTGPGIACPPSVAGFSRIKIGRYSGVKHSSIPDNAPPKKKALLIGVAYFKTSYSEPSNFRLTGAHVDVDLMRRLLVGVYGYAESDVVTLLDSEHGVQPTRANILRAIGDLVRGSRRGDRFFFLFHGCSMEFMSNSKDETDVGLKPADGEVITNTELRRHLIEPLPVDSSLVAVLDCSHSAALLDLAHLSCNRVYVPWISGTRVQRRDALPPMQRRNALPPMSIDHSQDGNGAVRLERRRRTMSTPTSPDGATFRDDGNGAVRLERRRRTMSMPTSPDGATFRDVRAATPPSSDNDNDHLQKEVLPASSLWLDKDGCYCESPEPYVIRPRFQSVPMWWLGKDNNADGGGRACDSPPPVWACQGWNCRDPNRTVASEADVIVLAACRDDEMVWEYPTGDGSITRLLARRLEYDPHPILRSLVTEVSHAMHEVRVNQHCEIKTYRRRYARYVARLWKLRLRGRLPVQDITNLLKDHRSEVDTETFQNPQLLSHLPLDMERIWDM
ncbi:caspase domain-containing protein [Mycena rebaudengoi]|nr:caspase domain-containing protein [Mycena rebaudengoi]